MTPAEKYQYAREFDRWLTRKERAASGVVLAWIRSVRDRLLTALEQLGIDRTLTLISELVAESPVRSMLNAVYRITLPDAAVRMFNQVVSRLRNPPPLLQAGFFSQRWQTEQIRIMLSPETASRISQITESTRQSIRRLLADAADKRLTVQQTSRRIRSVLGGQAAGKRALLIARTETTRAASVGAEAGAAATGIRTLKKTWIATADSRTRDAHLAMLRRPPIPKDDFFLVGGRRMRYPGDPAGGPANCCNCRCTVVYTPY